MKKNDLVEVDIEDMSDNGEGIGHADGLTLFVKDAVIGDRVLAGITKVKKTYCYARTARVLEPSAYRTEPRCPVYRPCGGCQLQNLDYKKQLEFKTRKVKNCFQRVGGFKVAEGNLSGGECNNSIDNRADNIAGAIANDVLYNSPENNKNVITVKDTIGMDNPWNYRNKAQFPIGMDGEGRPVAGFYAGRTHSVIPTSYCAIQFEGHEEILEKVLGYISQSGESVYDETKNKGVVRHILMRKAEATGEIMVVLVINGKKLRDEKSFVDCLKDIPGMTSIQLNFNTKDTNVILGNQCRVLWGKEYITDKIGEISYQISPLSFYQVNPVQTKVLYETALAYADLTGTETVWDLYCGIGTISLFLAQKAKQVYGVEIVPEAVENARANAKLNHIENAEFFTGAAEEIYIRKKLPADVVVVDPPRKGLDEELVNTIAKMKPERIVYVSCDPATMARDCRRFADNGYRVNKVQPVDMFGQGGHVECVVLLTKVHE
ncbi:MAG: 23S rRNA (uracil(1939)-C(5))-methyltransferase RlmD [Lachnospiraceae bacterium]